MKSSLSTSGVPAFALIATPVKATSPVFVRTAWIAIVDLGLTR
jgi:hypothetical protein